MALMQPAGASDFSGLIPGLKEAKEAALSACYAAHKNEKELYDLAIRIDGNNRIFGKDEENQVNDGEFVARLRKTGMDAWQRYQELGGPAHTMREVTILPDPCASVRKAF